MTSAQERTLPIPAEHREFTIKVEGEAMPREHQLLAVYITQAANKIGAARLVYLDGAAAGGDFPLSSSDLLLPGKNIEILAGTTNDPVSLFKGVVIQQSLKVRDHSAPQLVVECRHAAMKLAIGSRNAYFFDQTDSAVITKLLQDAGLTASVDSTSATHKQLVQYDCTDWDFLLTRAQANGLLVFTLDDTVTVKKPARSGSAVCTLQFGSTVLEFDAEMDARAQYDAVKSITWDAAQQALVEKEAADPNIGGPGNVSVSDLAGVAALDYFRLQHTAVTDTEAQSWADAQWLQSQLSKINGRAKCEGIATVKPGDIVELAGVGARFNGNAFVTGVRQDFDTVQGWKTHVQFGHTQQWLARDTEISAPKAAALLPGVNGLQIGVVVSNEDPDGEDRVRVRMPLVNNDDDGTWARVAALDAGNERGFFFRPEIGDEVVLGFFNDDPRQAVVLGMLNSSAKPAPLPGSDDNHEKILQSRSKMKVYFNDDKKILQLETPAGNKITLSEDDKAIKIADQNGNKIEMTSDGIAIESSKAIMLKAGTEVKFESGTAFAVKGGTELKMEGAAGVEISTSAVAKLKGSLVQIN